MIDLTEQLEAAAEESWTEEQFLEAGRSIANELDGEFDSGRGGDWATVAVEGRVVVLVFRRFPFVWCDDDIEDVVREQSGNATVAPNLVDFHGKHYTIEESSMEKLFPEKTLALDLEDGFSASDLWYDTQ